MLSRQFLVDRGYCCGHGCLMCPYIPKHIKGNKVMSKNILIVCALEVETQGQLDHLGPHDILYTGVGKVNATLELTRTLSNWMEPKLPNVIKLLICGISPIVCPSINQCCDVSLLISFIDFFGKTIFKCFFTRLL